MATKFYLRRDLHYAYGGTLPSAEQSTLTPDANDFGVSGNNYRMDTVKSTVAQTSFANTSTADTGAHNYYCARWVSNQINQTSIAANTWTVEYAASESNTSANFPRNGTGAMYVNCYVWKPSNGTKYGTILDGNSNTDGEEASTTQTVISFTFSGAAVSSLTAGDAVIVFELWAQVTQGASMAYTQTVFFDGTTENSTTNEAAFISTPENIALLPDISKSLTLKWNMLGRITKDLILKWNIIGRITKALILKWNIIGRITKDLILKWNILTQITKNLILKWNIEQGLTRITKDLILKWNIIGRITKNTILKWHIQNFITKNLTLKWNIQNFITKNLILKWHIQQRITKDTILKWNIIGRITKNIILKWNIIGRITKDLILKWNTVGRITKNLILKWDILEGGLTRITKNIILKWNVVGRVTKTVTLKWNIQNFITKNVTLKWNIQQRIIKNLTLKWHITNLVTKNLILKWHILSRVTKTLTLKWNILSDIIVKIFPGSQPPKPINTEGVLTKAEGKRTSPNWWRNSFYTLIRTRRGSNNEIIG